MVALEASKVFSRLPKAELNGLRAVTRLLSFQSGDLIFKEGDPGDGLYVVEHGRVQITALVGQDRRVISELQAGELFGELAVLDDQPRSASATAASPATVYFIPRAPLLELLRRTPELAMVLTQEITQRLRDFNRQYVREMLQGERMTLVGRFASSIVHDLKNPLSIISLASEMGCAQAASPSTRQMAKERIAQQVKRITHLVDDILDFASGSSSAQVPIAIQYDQFLRSLVADLHQETSLKQVATELVEPVPTLTLRGNPHRLSRVMFNLVGNAVDAMPTAGRIRIGVTVTAGELVTTVTDSGAGIAPDVKDHLFEPFVTFGKTRGTGLGLSICRRIIEEHGGRIWANNAPEGGAVFSFSLPLDGPMK